MKKLLSLILALTLTFALLPTFAAAVDMEPAILTPTEFTLDFKVVTSSFDKLTATNATQQRYYIKDGNEFFGSNWSFLTDPKKTTIHGIDGDKAIVYFGSELRLYFNLTSDNIAEGYDTAAIEIDVPKSGIYEISSEVYTTASSGYAEIFVDGKSIGKESLHRDDINDGKSGDVTVKFPKSVPLTSGKHILTIKNSVHTKTSLANAFRSITFTPATSQINHYVSFVQTTNVEEYNDINVTSAERGASVDLTAHTYDIPGYEFVGWKRGSSDDESAWVDINGDTYNVWTNTFLTAIYKPTGETATAKTVDFWNQNGAYLGTATEDTYATDVKRVPTLTGFGAFQGWFTDGKVQLTEETELKAGTTNAVAQYADSVVYGVKRDDSAVEDGDVKDGLLYYNEAITFEKKDTSSTCWMRDGKVISYDDTYTYNVWGATNIEEGTEEITDEKPVAILEYNDTYKAYMLEYDDGDYEIVEAGIIFGGADATVDSCTKKYTSQRKVEHNQFSVPAESGTAQGYIIWKNNSGVYNIEYFSVAE